MIEKYPELMNNMSLYVERIHWVLGKMNEKRLTPIQIMIKFVRNKDKFFKYLK